MRFCQLAGGASLFLCLLCSFISSSVISGSKVQVGSQSSFQFRRGLDGDDEEEHPFEWAGSFDLVAGDYTFIFSKVNGGYADATMKVVILSSDDSTEGEEAIEGTEEAAEGLFEGTATTEVKAGGTLIPSASTAYVLEFDDALDDSSFTLSITADSTYVVFMEHLPYEFEDDTHFLLDSNGADVEPSAEEGDGHGHGHGHDAHEEIPFEWAGSFDLPVGTYALTFSKVGGEYADETMLLALLPSTSSSGQEAIEALEEEAHEYLEHEEDATELQNGGTIVPSKAYKLIFDDTTDRTTFNVQIDSESTYVFFMQHLPYEFEADEHFFKDSNGADIEYTAEEMVEGDGHGHGDHGDGGKPWGEAIGGSILVNLVTLIGVVFLMPALAHASQNGTFGAVFKSFFQPGTHVKVDQNRKRVFLNVVLTAFSCGALLATAAFLILPEAYLLIDGYHKANAAAAAASAGSDGGHDGHGHRFLGGGHDDHGDGHDDHGGKEVETETESAWKFGVALLAGFFIPWAIGLFIPHGHDLEDDEHKKPELKEGGGGGEEEEMEKTMTMRNEEQFEDSEDFEINEEEDKPKTKSIHQHNHHQQHEQQRLTASVLAGDFFHNFADGIFIGVAFLVCDNTVGYSVLAATVYHELAQEIADFFLLTEYAGLSPCFALGLNFLSGLSVTLGAIVVLASNISDLAIGILLAMSGGVYLNICGVECLPRMDAAATTMQERLIAFLCLLVGAVPIGLVLLNHEHCHAH